MQDNMRVFTQFVWGDKNFQAILVPHTFWRLYTLILVQGIADSQACYENTLNML